jgi:hypothetical protein
MFDIIARYQASLFGNFEDIRPSPEIISKLLMLFRDKKLLPNTFQEISANAPGPQTRLRLSSENNQWNLNFATNRLDIEQIPRTDTKEKDIGTVEEFVKQACELFSRVLTEFKRRGNRISLITSGLLKEMSEEQLADIYNRLFKTIPFYHDNHAFEWNSRSVAKLPTVIGELEESINVITQINRVRGKTLAPIDAIEFDRIQIAFDINTIQENKETRFKIETVELFLSEANKIHNNLLKELLEFLNV